MTLYKWSQTAAADATADATINWQEGQAPSTINDSARAMMAATAKYRDDTAGLLFTSGTATAYSLTSNQGFVSQAAMNGAEISFMMHVTNGQNPTLSVDGYGAAALIMDSASGYTPVPAGTLIVGSVYEAVYLSSVNQWRMKNFYQVPYVMPIGAGMDYWGSSVPSNNFAFPVGQAISRTTYATLFALIGTQFGGGDGSTTFNLPDKRGRVSAANDGMGGSTAGRLTLSYFGAGNVVGTAGGSEGQVLSPTQIPQITSTASANLGVSVSSSRYVAQQANDASAFSAQAGGPTGGVSAGAGFSVGTLASSGSASGTVSSTSNNTGGAGHLNVQPTIICNYIIRII